MGRTDFEASDTFILIGMMVAMVAEVGQCKECYKNKLNVENIANKRMGYCYSIRIYCIDSGWSNVWRTSSTINKSNTPGQKPYEISQRMIYSRIPRIWPGFAFNGDIFKMFKHATSNVIKGI